MNKPELTGDLISLAESLIISGIVWSHKSDAPVEKRKGEEYPYTADDLESLIGTPGLRRIARLWVVSVIELNWDPDTPPNALWDKIIYTLTNGSVAVGRYLRRGMTTEQVLTQINARYMTPTEIVAIINSYNGLTASAKYETLDNCAIAIKVDSSNLYYRDKLRHNAVGDVVDAALYSMGLAEKLKRTHFDESASVAWYRIAK